MIPVSDLPFGVTPVTNIKGNDGKPGKTGTFVDAFAIPVPSDETDIKPVISGPEDARVVTLKVPRGLPGVNAVPAAEAVATYISAPDSDSHAAVLGVIASDESSVAAVANVRRFGAVGDGVNDDLAAIHAALAASEIVYLPPGTYLVSDEVKIPSNRTLYGAGMELTTIFLADSAPAGANVLTNEGNTRLAHTTPDVNIAIRDMTVDGNAWNRGDDFVLEPGRSCIAFATVEDSMIERVTAKNGKLHCIDISASVYNQETFDLAPGPSRNITLNDVVAIDSRVDDGLTTHHSENITFNRPRAIRTGNYALGTYSHGVEIDEGSRDVVVNDGYAEGWQLGFQAKGHETSRPATRVKFIRCKAVRCGVGFWVEFPVPESATDGTRWASDVQILDCEVSELVQLRPDLPQRYAVLVKGYDNVIIENLFVHDSPAGGNIMIDNFGTSNIRVRNITFEDVLNTYNAADALIHIQGGNGLTPSDAGYTSHDITIENVYVRTPIMAGVVSSTGDKDWTAARNVVVRNVNASPMVGVAGLHAVRFAYPLAGHSAREIFATGFEGRIRISSGPYAATFQSDNWQYPTKFSEWSTVPLQATGASGTIHIALIDGLVHLRGDAITINPAPSGVVTLATVPVGYRPPADIAVPVSATATPPRAAAGRAYLLGAGSLRWQFYNTESHSFYFVYAPGIA